MFGGFELVVLLTEDMLPVPKDIYIREDWGNVTIQDAYGEDINGKHVLIRGDENEVVGWLNSFKQGVWVNKQGYAPINKQFILIKGDGKIQV